MRLPNDVCQNKTVAGIKTIRPIISLRTFAAQKLINGSVCCMNLSTVVLCLWSVPRTWLSERHSGWIRGEQNSAAVVGSEKDVVWERFVVRPKGCGDDHTVWRRFEPVAFSSGESTERSVERGWDRELAS